MNLGSPRGMAAVAILEPCISVQDPMLVWASRIFDSRAEEAVLPRAITDDKPLPLFRQDSLMFCIVVCWKVDYTTESLHRTIIPTSATNPAPTHTVFLPLDPFGN